MRYAIDARWIPRDASGIGVYTRELVSRMPALDPSAEFLLYFRDPGLRDRLLAGGIGRHPNVRPVIVPYGIYSPSGQWKLARDLRARRVDLFHSPGYVFPVPAFPADRAGPIRLVVTLHDVVPLAGPSAVARSWKRRLLPLYRRIHEEALRRADRVICVSRTARRDVLRRLRVPAWRHGRARTVYNGVSDRFLSAARGPPRETPRKPTVLYVGRADPYKNLRGLVSAFVRVRERLGDGVRLRVVGPPDPRYTEPIRLAEAAGVGHAVEWSGYLSDEQLLEAYLAATVLVHPSRFEGFGLPVLEAMACGLPVICANRSALPEIADRAALYVDPDDADAMAEAILRVLEEPGLADALSRRGIARARCFTWERSARETLAVYGEALSGGGGPRLE